MDHKILALGGDGIGPEVLDFGLHLIYKIQDIFGINIKIEHDIIGGACWDKFQVFCKNETVEKANPIGMFLSIAMMFEYSFERKDISTIIEKAIDKLIYKVNLTPDLNGKLSTEEVFLKFIDELNNEARV